MLDKRRKKIYSDIENERLNQLKKWGDQRHSFDRWVVILSEELGEASKASLEDQFENWREEIVQIGAVAVAALEDFDRNSQLP